MSNQENSTGNKHPLGPAEAPWVTEEVQQLVHRFYTEFTTALSKGDTRTVSSMFSPSAKIRVASYPSPFLPFDFTRSKFASYLRTCRDTAVGETTVFHDLLVEPLSDAASMQFCFLATETGTHRGQPYRLLRKYWCRVSRSAPPELLELMIC